MFCFLKDLITIPPQKKQTNKQKQQEQEQNSYLKRIIMWTSMFPP